MIHQRDTVAGLRVYRVVHLRRAQSCQSHASHTVKVTTSIVQEPEFLCRLNQISASCVSIPSLRRLFRIQAALLQ